MDFFTVKMGSNSWIFFLLNVIAVNCQLNSWNYHETISKCDQSSCKTEVDNLVKQTVWQHDTNCKCDADCREYGDCCYDSPYFNLTKQEKSLQFYECLKIDNSDILVKAKCPAGYKNTEVRNACETTSQEDLLLFLPVTNSDTNVTYKNSYCALCNNDANTKIWRINLKFKDLIPGDISQQEILRHIYFNKTENSWGVDQPDFFAKSDIIPVIPEGMNATYLRQCISRTIDSCPVGWDDPTVDNLCKSYSYTVFDGNGKAFQNPHCAECNKIKQDKLSCKRTTDRDFIDDILPLAVLFDLNQPIPGKKNICQDGELYNILSKTCHKLPKTILIIENNNNTYFENCEKLILQKNPYAENEYQNFSIFSQSEPFGDYKINEEGEILICADALRESVDNRFNKTHHIITFIGFLISIFFIIIHLITFVTTPALQSFSGKNFSSLCVALLVTYVSLIVGNSVSGHLCFMVAVTTSYALLAAFFWMLIISYDVSRTINLATNFIKSSREKQWTRFAIYSLLCWTLPGLITGIAIWMDISPDALSYLKPMFTYHTCWFGNRQALVLFFILPFTAIMILNSMFFFLSACRIYLAKKGIHSSKRSHDVFKFTLYLKFIVIMGMTWTTGFLANAINNDILWCMFTFLNTLQGFFICIGFTFKKQITQKINLRFSKARLISIQSKFTSTVKIRV